MQFYFTKSPRWLQLLYAKCVWRITTNQKNIYLTFDDGPHPTITPFVLQQLEKFNAKATFFCIGDNVKKHPQTFAHIQAAGHAVGNHTMHHVNGWRTKDEVYIKDVTEAAALISSNLFRPPYGRITKSQINQLIAKNASVKIIMWSVLAGDWDKKLTVEACLQKLKKNIDAGSIVVFHDSEKAYERLAYTLPKLLQYLSDKGYHFKTITFEEL
jgi:peptidoglycan-N-acetylglucosamine deacetylase